MQRRSIFCPMQFSSSQMPQPNATCLIVRNIQAAYRRSANFFHSEPNNSLCRRLWEVIHNSQKDSVCPYFLADISNFITMQEIHSDSPSIPSNLTPICFCCINPLAGMPDVFALPVNSRMFVTLSAVFIPTTLQVQAYLSSHALAK